MSIEQVEPEESTPATETIETLAAALRQVAFSGPLEVELSRHSALAPTTARSSLAFLQTAFRA